MSTLLISCRKGLFFKVSTYYLSPERTTNAFKALHENFSPALIFALNEVDGKCSAFWIQIPRQYAFHKTLLVMIKINLLKKKEGGLLIGLLGCNL